MFRLFLTLPILLSACLKDETVSGFADPETVFHLEEMAGTPFAARATISFPAEGIVKGRGPCNSYSAAQSAPYPWFELGPMAATRAACADLNAEQKFFAALGTMAFVEALGDLVILRNDAGDEMIFRAR